MASSGYLTINDGIMPDASSARGLSTSFSVNLECSQNAAETNGSYAFKVYFSKTINRLAPIGNPVKNAKMLISKYAGCDEAAKVRKVVLALARIKLSVSQEQFRFRLTE